MTPDWTNSKSAPLLNTCGRSKAILRGQTPFLLMEYTLRRSSRARHVRFHINPVEGLVVVVPLRFDSARVPELLDIKRSWIDRKLSALKKIDPDISPPDTIELKSVEKTWHVDYRPTSSASVGARANGRRPDPEWRCRRSRKVSCRNQALAGTAGKTRAGAVA